MNQEIVEITPDQVVGACARKKAEGCRFVTMTCVALDEERLEVLYHFDRDFQLEHLRLTVSKDMLLHSVSDVYFAAFLVENEIQDLFGLRFAGLAIDYRRTLYLDPEIVRSPFCKYAVKTEANGPADPKLP